MTKNLISGGRQERGITRLICEREVAAMLGVSLRTIQSWRMRNEGPRFRRLRRAVRYAVEDIENWVANCPAGGDEVRSTLPSGKAA